jgi:hypothetical protein
VHHFLGLKPKKVFPAPLHKVVETRFEKDFFFSTLCRGAGCRTSLAQAGDRLARFPMMSLYGC